VFKRTYEAANLEKRTLSYWTLECGCVSCPNYIHLCTFLAGEGYWGLKSGPCACYAGTLPLKPHLQSFLFLVIFQIESCVFCTEAALDHNSSTYVTYTALQLHTYTPTQLQVQATTFGLFVEMMVSLTFCTGWSQTMILSPPPKQLRLQA
jgi:hypothetical protein